MSEYLNFEVFDGDMFLENKAITGRMEIIYEALDRAEKNAGKLENAVKKYEEDGNHSALWTKAYRFSESMLENIEKVESEFPDVLRETDYGRLHNAINHMYWRLDEGRWREKGSQSIINEIEKILDKRPIIDDIKLELSQNLETVYFRPPVDDFKEDFKQAKDLIALEHYDTAIFVLCRACEQAEYVLGKERKIESVEYGGRSMDWGSDKLPAWARNEALFAAEFPDNSGKMIDKATKKKFERIRTDLRNDTAHLSKKNYDRDEALNEFKNLKKLLMNLSEEIANMREFEEEVDPISNQTISQPDDIDIEQILKLIQNQRTKTE